MVMHKNVMVDTSDREVKNFTHRIARILLPFIHHEEVENSVND